MKKSNVDLINETVWNTHPKYMHLLPHDFILTVSEEEFAFTTDSVVVNSKDEMVCVISKTRCPNKIVMNHKHSVLDECANWLIKYCEAFNKLLPTFESSNESIFDRLEAYKEEQRTVNKKRRWRKAKPLYK